MSYEFLSCEIVGIGKIVEVVHKQRKLIATQMISKRVYMYSSSEFLFSSLFRRRVEAELQCRQKAKGQFTLHDICFFQIITN